MKGAVTFSIFLLAGSLAWASETGDRGEDSGYNLQGAASYLDARNGHALLVYREGELIFEKYFNGHSADKAHRLASGTKSFSGVLAVMAVEDGLLELDEKVSETIIEWAEDPKKEPVTIRQLLSLSSGIEGGDNGKVPSGIQAVRMAEMTGRIGENFSYGPIPFQVWGELLRRKLEPKNESVEDYLKRRLFDQIGMKARFWRKDDQGAIQFPSGAFITAKEWAKFGLFVLNDGEWEDEQVVSKELLQECFLPSEANSSYGLTFWLGQWEGLPGDILMAAGKGKQKLYIVPSEDLLIVQLAEAEGYDEREFLSVFFGEGEASGTQGQQGSRRQGVEYRFRNLDTDGDGKVSREESKGWPQFDRVDANSDGYLTREELGAFLRSRARR